MHCVSAVARVCGVHVEVNVCKCQYKVSFLISSYGEAVYINSSYLGSGHL